MLTPEFLGLVPGFFASDVEQAVRALDGLLSLCFAREVSAEDRYTMLGCAVTVPPYVRQALLSRSIDNDDILPRLRKPVLVTHGTEDRAVTAAVLEQQMARIASARIQRMATGHACFWDDAAGYNRALKEFAEAL